jgi:hypothetical protein
MKQNYENYYSISMKQSCNIVKKISDAHVLRKTKKERVNHINKIMVFINAQSSVLLTNNNILYTVVNKFDEVDADMILYGDKEDMMLYNWVKKRIMEKISAIQEN